MLSVQSYILLRRSEDEKINCGGTETQTSCYLVSSFIGKVLNVVDAKRDNIVLERRRDCIYLMALSDSCTKI